MTKVSDNKPIARFDILGNRHCDDEAMCWLIEKAEASMQGGHLRVHLSLTNQSCCLEEGQPDMNATDTMLQSQDDPWHVHQKCTLKIAFIFLFCNTSSTFLPCDLRYRAVLVAWGLKSSFIATTTSSTYKKSMLSGLQRWLSSWL